MKFYKVTVDSNSVQLIIPDVSESIILDYTSFNCELKQKGWENVNWYIYNPKVKVKNFFSLGSSSAFAFDENVYDSDLFTLLEMAGQIIPINVEGKRLYILNVMNCINILNKGETERFKYDNGSEGRILKYAFYENRISESTLFKIPETCKGEILTYTSRRDLLDEFKSLYEQLEFTGLVFEEI